MMEESLRALRRTPSALLIFMGLYVPVATGITLLGKLYLSPEAKGGYDLPEVWIDAIRFGTDLLQAGVIALAQTLAFSRIGREMDRPLWKVSNDRDALRLYYRLWLILALMNVLSSRLINMAVLRHAEEGSVALLLYLQFVIVCTSVPVGAAIMFHGPMSLASTRQAIVTLAEEFQMTLGIIIFSFAFLVIVFVIAVNETTPLWGFPIIQLAESIFDCFIFGCAWQLCRIHRERIDDDTDFDF